MTKKLLITGGKMLKNKRGKKVALFIAVATILAVFLGIVTQQRCAAQGANDYESIELFTDVLTIVKRSYVEEVDTKKLIYGAINGMLSSLDPHSSFMPPDVYKEMMIETKGSFGGLGIEISIKDGMLTVISPIEDTPAYKAGIKAGDQILKIEDKFTKDLSVMDAVKRMRGPKGSKITITIMRDGFEKPKEFTLVRDTIQVKSVKYKMLDKGFGYIRIAEFQEKTDDDLVKAFQDLRLRNNGNLHGLVLDLRNDPGGLLDQAVRVADHFLDDGQLIVYTEGRAKDSKMRFTASRGEKEPHYPMVVLINSGSASASEIVAGALQDHKRSVTMGTQSFGKGSVQTIIPLSDNSGLRLTTARYFTPSGRSIQAKGITPDIVVEDVALSTAGKKEGLQISEKDLKNHFEAGKQESGEEKQIEKLPVYKTDEQIKSDYQVLRALDLLKGWDILKKMGSASK
jgi:carboxyl-terminal processing protease